MFRAASVTQGSKRSCGCAAMGHQHGPAPVDEPGPKPPFDVKRAWRRLVLGLAIRLISQTV